MASKENQEAFDYLLDHLVPLPDDNNPIRFNKFGECREILQKAIDDLELNKKAFELVCKDYAYEYDTDGKEYENEYLQKARMELKIARKELNIERKDKNGK